MSERPENIQPIPDDGQAPGADEDLPMDDGAVPNDDALPVDDTRRI